MNVFYNKNGIGDTLIVRLSDVEDDKRKLEKKGDVARIYDGGTGVSAGYNLFRASQYGEIEGHGVLKKTENLVNVINQALEANGFDERFHHDETPDFPVGFVKDKKTHPDADKLSVCQVDVGNEELQIVCGAPNVESGQKVVVARVGAVMPSGMIIKDASLRGVESSGMICAARELDLPNAPQEKGIIVLTDDREIGSDFFDQAATKDEL
ncbi:MAG TPA: DUF4479 domain-containing protein [Bacillales bacterium]|nr:DUF4479 domain-containing protein [Bacillales bacterium]